MYRIVLACTGVATSAGPAAALDITEEFKRRPWHTNVTCVWDGSRLVLQAENDFDADGRALADEFSDAISSCMMQAFDGEIITISTTQF
jgi:hypothetical protein